MFQLQAEHFGVTSVPLAQRKITMKDQISCIIYDTSDGRIKALQHVKIE